MRTLGIVSNFAAKKFFKVELPDIFNTHKSVKKVTKILVFLLSTKIWVMFVKKSDCS